MVWMFETTSQFGFIQQNDSAIIMNLGMLVCLLSGSFGFMTLANPINKQPTHRHEALWLKPLSEHLLPLSEQISPLQRHPAWRVDESTLLDERRSGGCRPGLGLFALFLQTHLREGILKTPSWKKNSVQVYLALFFLMNHMACKQHCLWTLKQSHNQSKSSKTTTPNRQWAPLDLIDRSAFHISGASTMALGTRCCSAIFIFSWMSCLQLLIATTKWNGKRKFQNKNQKRTVVPELEVQQKLLQLPSKLRQRGFYKTTVEHTKLLSMDQAVGWGVGLISWTTSEACGANHSNSIQ